MGLDDPSDGDDREAVVAVDTGRRGQRLICEGWFASHADSGTPGPHLHLRTSDGETPVVRTDQLPGLIAALETVAERIERLWATDGDSDATPTPDACRARGLTSVTARDPAVTSVERAADEGTLQSSQPYVMRLDRTSRA